MTAPAAQAVTMSESVTSIVVRAGEDIAGGLIDRGFQWVEAQPNAAAIVGGIAIGLAGARVLMPAAQRWAASTDNKYDDRVVAVVAWIVGASSRRLNKDG